MCKENLMAFIVPGVCRFAARGLFAGRQVVNVFDMRIDTTGSTMSRLDAIEDQAKVLIESIVDHIVPRQVGEFAWQDVTWVDLDDEDGPTGSGQAGNGGTSFPDSGNVAAAGIPPNSAVLMTKAVPSQRGRRNGRTYWCGVPESDTSSTSGQSLTGGALTTWQTAADDFLASMNQDGDATTYDSRMCVVHILTRGPDTPEGNPGPPLTGDSRDVAEVPVDALLATQRRRLRG